MQIIKNTRLKNLRIGLYSMIMAISIAGIIAFRLGVRESIFFIVASPVFLHLILTIIKPFLSKIYFNLRKDVALFKAKEAGRKENRKRGLTNWQNARWNYHKIELWSLKYEVSLKRYVKAIKKLSKKKPKPYYINKNLNNL